MGVHDGHRNRLRERFTEYGLDSFNDVNVLELLLFYSIPRKDTNEIAHRLLDHFGSLSDLFDASVQELMEVDGISYNTAVLITLLPQVMKKVEVSRTVGIRKILNSKDAGGYFLPRFMNERDEVLYMLCLDNKRSIICCREMARGTVNSVEANVRRIVETALKAKSTSVILAHNHPGGIALPSHEDDFLTKSIYKSLQVVGILLEDHIIVSGKEFVSIADSGMMHLYKY